MNLPPVSSSGLANTASAPLTAQPSAPAPAPAVAPASQQAPSTLPASQLSPEVLQELNSRLMTLMQDLLALNQTKAKKKPNIFDTARAYNKSLAQVKPLEKQKFKPKPYAGFESSGEEE